MDNNPLSQFHTPASDWFARALGEPTPVQAAAWPVIASGGHTLVSAPTGTGKTLSAFFVFLDRLKAEARAGTLTEELRLIYVSPLKSLAGDIRENLRRPLDGISQTERRLGAASPDCPFDISAAVRTGDTTAAERRRMIKHPPHILITTPESLYLLLTSVSGQKLLKTARAVILDELHALINTKRGAHLMLSLARLDTLCGKPLQRIGLSATIRPLSLAAEYLSPEPVTIAAPDAQKTVELTVISPFPKGGVLPQGTIWPELARAVLEACSGARTAIAFTEGRMHAEKLAYYVNELAGEDFARTHHGSVSKDRRAETENALRAGTLRLLCATSSMELGIDVGAIDVVLQIGCPRGVSSALQRLGRAGHTPGGVSVMKIFPRTASEGLYCGLTARAARDGGIEPARPPELCLDILAQHLVSMTVCGAYTVDDVTALLPRAYPFRALTREDVESVLKMLAGDFEHRRDIPVRPRLLYDRVNGTVSGDNYSRLIALSAGGAIPDRGMYTVRAESGVKLGELDEEFVFEARAGDKFLLGAFAWKITGFTRDAVTVAPTNTEGASPPFWKGDWFGRAFDTGLRFGKILRELSDAESAGALTDALFGLGLDGSCAERAADYLRRQIDVTGVLPDDTTIIAEHFTDETGVRQLMIHSVFGRQVNAPLSILAREAAKRLTGMDVGEFDDDDGFMLFPFSEGSLPEGILQELDAEKAEKILTAILPVTPLFNMAFRYNAARSLMTGARAGGRQPLWVQRLRAAELLEAVLQIPEHPLIRETTRECLENLWDMDGLRTVLRGIQSGQIRVREVWSDEPSPMSLPLRRAAEATLLYEYSPTPSGVSAAVERSLVGEDMLPPSPERLKLLSEAAPAPENEERLHTRLMIEGDAVAGELDAPGNWFERLSRAGRAKYIEPGLWIAAEHAEDYAAALERGGNAARENIVRRLLRYRGAQTAQTVAERYFWRVSEAESVLTALVSQKNAVLSGEAYYHAELYDRARRETVKDRRRAVVTRPPEAYAALLSGGLRAAAPPEEQLLLAVNALRDEAYPAELWENVLLPARVRGYRPAMLDTLLTKGEVFWHMSPDGAVRFRLYEDIDWDAALPEWVFSDGARAVQKKPLGELPDGALAVYGALARRGASFAHALPLTPGADTLAELVKAGLIRADSFAPVRQLLSAEKTAKLPDRRRRAARALSAAGRWEITRPLRESAVEQQIDRAFDRAILLCRETVRGVNWSAALEQLRMWEFTGRVRRGYFIEGLSGAQFIRERDYAGASLAMDNPRDEIVWLNAADPLQPWGRSLAHRPERAFILVPGTVVALHRGAPVAVFERRGGTLRVFDGDVLPEALRAFARAFTLGHSFPQLKRVTVKDYPPDAADALAAAGFQPQMRDFALFRGVV